MHKNQLVAKVLNELKRFTTSLIVKKNKKQRIFLAAKENTEKSQKAQNFFACKFHSRLNITTKNQKG